jgi:hypothetical protein
MPFGSPVGVDFIPFLGVSFLKQAKGAGSPLSTPDMCGVRNWPPDPFQTMRAQVYHSQTLNWI